MSKLASTFKLISTIILVVLTVTFVMHNMHTTEIHFPFKDPVQINVIFLFLIGFLTGSAGMFVIRVLNRFSKKKSRKEFMGG